MAKKSRIISEEEALDALDKKAEITTRKKDLPPVDHLTEEDVADDAGPKTFVNYFTDPKLKLPSHIMKRLSEIEQDKQDGKPFEIRAAQMREGIFCTYTAFINLGEGMTNESNTKSTVPMHSDMIEKFEALDHHIQILDLDLETALRTHDGANGEGFKCVGIILDNKLGKEGVTLLGRKYLKHGPLELRLPKLQWNSGYKFMPYLTVAVYDLIAEVEQYAKGLKRAPDAQQSLDFEGEKAPYAETGL